MHVRCTSTAVSTYGAREPHARMVQANRPPSAHAARCTLLTYGALELYTIFTYGSRPPYAVCTSGARAPLPYPHTVHVHRPLYARTVHGNHPTVCTYGSRAPSAVCTYSAWEPHARTVNVTIVKSTVRVVVAEGSNDTVLAVKRGSVCEMGSVVATPGSRQLSLGSMGSCQPIS
ncbi:hypothetical protein JB92DRAFT_2826176 [Gautieria morchelliformis]|nr:hypothetical protein JB92DRAFT_2826176 [Gautieria morchelliformis]